MLYRLQQFQQLHLCKNRYRTEIITISNLSITIKPVTITHLSTKMRNQTSNLSHSSVYGTQKTQQVVVGSKPDELLYQKKFGLSSSLVNAIHMFAPSQNHKPVVYNPKYVNPTVVVSHKRTSQSQHIN